MLCNACFGCRSLCCASAWRTAIALSIPGVVAGGRSPGIRCLRKGMGRGAGPCRGHERQAVVTASFSVLLQPHRSNSQVVAPMVVGYFVVVVVVVVVVSVAAAVAAVVVFDSVVVDVVASRLLL